MLLIVLCIRMLSGGSASSAPRAEPDRFGGEHGRSKKADAAMDAPLKTTVDLTVSAAAPNGTRPPPAAAAEAEAAATPVIPQSAPPSAGRKRRAPPPESSSDDSVSDGGGFDGFDSDLIDSFARNGGRSSSESEEE